jgi:hypothetical protein
VSIDAKIRDVEHTQEGYVLHLEPRYSQRDRSWSIPGQRSLIIKDPTWEPGAGMEIWGSETIIIETEIGPMHYLRPGYTWLREWFKGEQR